MNLFCPTCGKKLIDQNAKFCSNCGVRIVKEESYEVDTKGLPEERIDLREGLTKGNKGFHQYTKWGKRKKKAINWDMDK